jgi:hypothetical protein
VVAVSAHLGEKGAGPVMLAAGDGASGLANIVGQYVEQILTEVPAKRAEATRLRGRLGLLAREGDIAVTIVFDDGRLVIEEGLNSPDAVISGDVQVLMHVLAGRRNPVWALGRRRMAVRPGAGRPLFAYQAYRFMRLPDVHLWSGLPRPPAAVVVGAAAATALLVIVWRQRAARRARGEE